MYKKILPFLFFAACSIACSAQVFNNQWIDYNKKYYKFKVGPFGFDIVGAPVKNGVVRITQPALASAGLGNIPAEQLQLWRDGAQVPLFISKTTGILSSTDYIEFWGEIANGKTDKDLYKDTSFQLSDYWNLESDSASYFLTLNNAGNNKRFVLTPNNVSAVTIAPERNFMYTRGRYFRAFANGGYGVFSEVYLYSSQYDRGEGFTSRPVRRNGSYLGQPQLPQNFPKLYLDNTGPSMTAYFLLTGNASYDRDVRISLNNDSLIQFNMGYYSSKKLSLTGLAASIITNDTAQFLIENISTFDADELRVATIEITYPRFFNFDSASSFEFNIAASANGRYLKIANFSRGSSDAVLYDFTNNKKYIADLSLADTLQFLLQPSGANYHLVLVRGDGSAAIVINALESRTFTNFSQTGNQGNYLIISNPVLYGSGTQNYVEQYRAYRSSDSGGQYNAKVIDIHDLEDQFIFGAGMHPLAVKNFLKYARQNFAVVPGFAFIVGKGVTYTAYKDNTSNPLVPQINLVPVFGSPGSDNLLASDNYDPVPATPVGRLSAVSPQEVGDYLAKIKQYEAAQRNTSQTLENKQWMKKVLQLAGANDPLIEKVIDSSMLNYRKIISDTLYGGDVKLYTKTSDPGLYPSSIIDFTRQFNEGSNIVEYFGHSSSTSIDFNLDDPTNYSNTGKYPLFIVNGCLAGNIFDYEVNRLNGRSTLSEKFVLQPQRGAIGYLSTSSYGIIAYLDIFTEQYYKSIAYREYGQPFGIISKDAISNALNYTGTTDFYARLHAEQYTFHGDPALRLNSFNLPDYIADSGAITISPEYLFVANDSFSVSVGLRNLGKAITDSVHFSLLRKYPDGSSDTAFVLKMPAIKSADTLIIKLPIIADRDKGTTILTAIIDDDKRISEISELNNIASIKVNISAADLIPVSPYNYAIVNTNTVNIAASSAYPQKSITKYLMEMDTTSLFNSPLKITRDVVSAGGLIEFADVPLSLNNKVYYWRVAEDSVNAHWNSFSFTHRNPGTTGFEQAHFYQHTQSYLNGLILDSASRAFKFASSLSNLYIQHSIYPTSGDEDAQFSVSLNGTIISWSACVGSSIIFNVFDPVTFKPVLNTSLPYNAGAICDSMRRYNFEYSTQSAATRKNAMDFLDYYVPNGYYVLARKIYDFYNNDWAPTVWAADTAIYGHNNSLYHRLKDQGTEIDSFTYPRTFIFVFRKNDSAAYKPISVLSKGVYNRISFSGNINTIDTTGNTTSPLFGPVKLWNKVKWYGEKENSNNITSLDVLAVNKNGKDSVAFNIDTSQHELDISSLNASVYPYVQLRMNTKDSLTEIPYQLNDWSVECQPVPEGAVAPNLGIDIPDSLSFDHNVNMVFDTLKGYLVFKNISSSAFTPLKINLVLYDANNTPHSFSFPRTRALPAGDTVHVAFLVNVTALPAGKYNLLLEVNPDNDQSEQYHFNNKFYQYVIIQRGAVLPVKLLDFTAQRQNKSVLLTWTVTNEINVSGYDIEFSQNGNTFKTIGNVSATNILTPSKKYSFIHQDPVNGKNYYRIRMNDKDGKYTYSPVRNIDFNNSNILVFPNPFTNILNIIANNNAQAVSVKVLDVAGKIILEKNLGAATTLNLQHLAAGMYILQVNDGATVQSFKVHKQ